MLTKWLRPHLFFLFDLALENYISEQNGVVLHWLMQLLVLIITLVIGPLLKNQQNSTYFGNGLYIGVGVYRGEKVGESSVSTEFENKMIDTKSRSNQPIYISIEYTTALEYLFWGIYKLCFKYFSFALTTPSQNFGLHVA